MKKIAILNAGYESYAFEKELFAAHGYSLMIYDNPESQVISPVEFAHEAEGILVRGTLIDESFLKDMPNLKAIVRYGVGYDNIDLESVWSRNIRLANVQGYANHSVSDHAMALMFACSRDLGASGREDFGVPTRKDMFELHDKMLGIIGIGRIGSHFSRKASPFFEHTLAYDPYKDSEYMASHGAVMSDLPQLLQKSHVISLHCNMTDETRHILDASGFQKMENRPVIINTARGPVIHEKDLLNALENDMIHSAGLDVYEQEPPGEFQVMLMEHPRVVATLHVAWYSSRSMIELQKRAASNMIALLSGLQVSDELFPE